MAEPLAPASALTLLPNSLYNSAISAVTTAYTKTKSNVRYLPAEIQFDIYEKLYRDGRLCTLAYEFCDLDIFFTVLNVQRKRYELHQIFQALIDHGLRLPDILVREFCQRSYSITSNNRSSDERSLRDLMSNGFAFGSFLIEAGWYQEGAKCVEACFDVCQLCTNQSSLSVQRWIIESYVWRLEAYNGYCRYEEAKRIYNDSQHFIDGLLLGVRSDEFCFAELYAQYSSLFFNIGHYDVSNDWAVKSLQELSNENRSRNWSPSTKTVIRVFSQVSKILVVRRQFRRAELLIKNAVALSFRHYDRGRRFPSPLLDFGFYLMNVDLNEAASRVCQIALDYRQTQFGGRNLKLAHAHEDLAYALYVLEYSTGQFGKAKEHADRAISILKAQLPDNHLLLASCQRVKALILEEIAIDSQDKNYEAALLQEAEELHLAALSVCKRLFGENNIQTAKHYGNLGRLYQSLKRYDEAEMMHLKAVSIKERLLGPDDYEVALSIGHLASLYSYDMGRHEQAEQLYLRSIEIGKRLFGDSYSGLEYDYRGLVHVYLQRNDRDRANVYMNALHRWKMLRDTELSRANPLSVLNEQEPFELEDTQSILEQFFRKDL